MMKNLCLYLFWFTRNQLLKLRNAFLCFRILLLKFREEILEFRVLLLEIRHWHRRVVWSNR